MAQEEEICSRISESVKMAGFLEKKGKMKIVSPWKKYWFVLEERLLLYYRSQIEYINLSPCRGSLNMGLVTTVRPGSSTGPCVIHVITRTQIVQLRAKNRETQEEWLKALLDSMSLPIFSKTLKAPLVADLHGHRYSMDNVHDRLKKSESERSERFRGFGYGRREMSDAFYGGSLDTVIWSKKFRTASSPSPNMAKGKMFEKILGYVEEVDAKSMSDMVSLLDDDASGSAASVRKKKYVPGGRDDELEEEEEEEDGEGEGEEAEKENGAGGEAGRSNSKSEDPCGVSGSVEKVDESRGGGGGGDDESRKASDADGKVKMRVKEESQFERIKNAMRKTRNKAFKSATADAERKPGHVKKRRQSFLQKVFKKRYRTEEKGLPGDDSDADDPLYDTIENVHEQKESLISTASDSSQEQKAGQEDVPRRELDGEASESAVDKVEDVVVVVAAAAAVAAPPAAREIQGPVFGSKVILSAQAMTELKSKLKSRVSHIASDASKEESELAEAFDNIRVNEESSIPDLPPRRNHARPRSPWHDVPVNNAPVGSAAGDTSFGIRRAGVKFHDDALPTFHRSAEAVYKEEVEESPGQAASGRAESNLSVLLEQLTEMTSASLSKPSDAREPSPDADKFWMKSATERRFSDPDYDIPRPHKLANLCISDEDDKIFEKIEDNSDSSSSFQSIEPDSLESGGKKSKM